VNLSSWVIYLALGKIFIYLWQQFPLPSRLEKIKVINKLHLCSLCSGVWIYSILACAMRMDILVLFGFPFVFLIGWIVTGGVSSFLIHLISMGWNDQFAVEIK
jgi:hypothetical protein